MALAGLWQPLDGHILMHGGRGLERLTARQAVNALSAWAPTVGVNLASIIEPTPEPTTPNLLAIWGDGGDLIIGDSP